MSKADQRFVVKVSIAQHVSGWLAEDWIVVRRENAMIFPSSDEAQREIGRLPLAVRNAGFEYSVEPVN
jgi:hypothetical protein